jgi:hypothetical protein
MKPNRSRDFGAELRRPFEVHESCYDCVEFYDGCNAWPASKEFACTDYHQLPDVMPGTCGQVFPPSRMKGRKEPRAREEPPRDRFCGCGDLLPKGKQLCEQCRIQNRRQSVREYKRQRRASVAVEADSDVRPDANGAGVLPGRRHDLPSTRSTLPLPTFSQTSVGQDGPNTS